MRNSSFAFGSSGFEVEKQPEADVFNVHEASVSNKSYFSKLREFNAKLKQPTDIDLSHIDKKVNDILSLFNEKHRELSLLYEQRRVLIDEAEDWKRYIDHDSWTNAILNNGVYEVLYDVVSSKKLIDVLKRLGLKYSTKTLTTRKEKYGTHYVTYKNQHIDVNPEDIYVVVQIYTNDQQDVTTESDSFYVNQELYGPQHFHFFC